ncbi:MAG: sulfatase-like hydrolase/transferase, partial [Planctomycetota bacterium]
MPLRPIARFLFSLATLLLIAKFGTAAEEPVGPGPEATADKPNVLFLFTDDQRADTIGALGNPHIITPNLDAIAERGFSFSRCYCLGANSGAVCFPSRNMLLSGRTYFRHVVKKKGNRRYADPAKPNFADALNAAGYETYHHGKKGNTASLLHTRFDHSQYLSNDHQVRMSGQPGKEIVDAALTFLDERQSDQPFAMYLAFGTPHDPRVAAEEFRSQYDPAELPIRPNFLPLHPYAIGSDLVRDELLAPFPRTLPDTRAQIHDYYAAITGLDHHIGRLIADLDERGELENTLIVFSSDHGLAMGSHGRFGKQSLYSDDMRAPLMFAGPGIPNGRSDAMVYLHDIYPTICDLLGVDPAGGSTVPAELHGRSFKTAFTGEEAGRPALFGSYLDHQRSVYDGRWKL